MTDLERLVREWRQTAQSIVWGWGKNATPTDQAMMEAEIRVYRRCARELAAAIKAKKPKR